jgi:hypothetical protein
MLYKGTSQIVPIPINTYKYITGTLNKGKRLKGENGKGIMARRWIMLRRGKRGKD